MDFDITIYEEYSRRVADLIFGDIKINGGLHQDKYKEIFIRIISNLRVSYELMRPLRYSRNKDHYINCEHGYTTTMKLIDTMVTMGFIEHCVGQYGDGRQSRMWVENKINTLFDIFMAIHPDSVVKEPPEPVVQLKTRKVVRNGKTVVPAHVIPYKRTHVTNRMTKQLDQYNELLRNTKIECHTDWAELNDIERKKLITLISEKRYSKLTVMYPIILNSTIPYTNINTISVPNILIYSNQYTTNRVPYTITTKSFSKDIAVSILNYYGIDESKVAPYLPQKEVLGVGISLKYKSLHRSFTEDFNLGGRFYGASWLDISRQVRKDIFINDERVVEPDFSSYHLRMLYHEEGIDYKEDAYAFIDNAHRGLVKDIAMAVINVNGKRNIVNAVKKLFGWKKIEGFYQIDYDNNHIIKHGTKILEKEYINKLVKDFCDCHSVIYSKFFKDSGLRLQNIDGRITSEIIGYFLDKDIPVLGVHDSYIIQERYKEELIKVMMGKYRDEMKFYPVIG